MKYFKYNRKVWSWALFDWANSAYATVVMAGFFPLFFKKYWAIHLTSIESTYLLGAINMWAGLIIALLAPILGILADRGKLFRILLILTTLLGAVSTVGFYWVDQGEYPQAMLLYALSLIGFSSAMIFYDASLNYIAADHEKHRVSALGYAVGYLGGGLLFAFTILMTLQPHAFLLRDTSQAVLISFVLVGIWWLLFSLPLFKVIQSPIAIQIPLGKLLVGAAKQLRTTISDLRKLPGVGLFLLAYWFYIDGVGTVIKMSVDYGLALGFSTKNLMLALLITQFVGLPATLLYARLTQHISPRMAIGLGLLVYMLITLLATLMQHAWQFYLLAIMVGLVQGGVQAMSRSYFAAIIPPQQSNEYFGFYNMLGKFAAILGPMIIGISAALTQSHRLSILSINIFFIIGIVLLWLSGLGFRAKQ